MNPTDSGVNVSMRKIFLVVAFVIGACLIAFSTNPGLPNASAEESRGMSMGADKSSKSPHKTESAMDMNMSSGGMSPGMKIPSSPPPRPVRYVMSPEAKMLAEVETVSVKRKRAFKELRMVGMVFEAETRVATLVARVAGRLDRVYIDFTGVEVKKGDPMVTIWSPTLIKTQVELFESIKSGDTEGIIRGAEEKLMQYGLTKEQIKRIRESRKPDLYITLRAPIGGVVMKKNAILGQFVNEGQEMFIINDLSHVWVQLDAYEQNMPWIRYGQNVNFTTAAVPGKTFAGKVIFIDPVLNMNTRTVNIRVDTYNPEFELKPHMFVNALLQVEIDESGKVINTDWRGKYICPFHPEEVSSTPGICPESKQPLRPASAYGYSESNNPVLPLVIPQTAVLYTGTRSLVYVEVPNQAQPTYEQREVLLGPKATDGYVIYRGLKEGERVVTKGNFQIDSSVQILGEPSMMNPANPSSDGQQPSETHGSHRTDHSLHTSPATDHTKSNHGDHGHEGY
ncbi:MAG: efflux RND transporter periplasmic adaptor subunit [Desulfomonilaceae bacterium]